MQISEFIELAKLRRSIRGYQDKPVPKEYLEKIVEAAHWAPSGYNKQPWKFVVVDEKEQREKVVASIGEEVSQTKERVPEFNGKLAPYLAKVPAFIAVVGKPSVREEFPPNRRGMSADKIYFASFAAAIQNILLAATSLGLGSVFFTVGSEDWAQAMLKQVLGVPADEEVLFCIPVGYPEKELETPGEDKRLKLDEIMSWNKY